MSEQGGASEAQASNQPISGGRSTSRGVAALLLKMRPKGHGQQDTPESSLNCRFLGSTLQSHSFWDMTLRAASFTSSPGGSICSQI